MQERDMPKHKDPVGMRFVGDPATFVPGWPNEDHNEPDEALAGVKAASGRYKASRPVPPPPEPPAPEPEPEPEPRREREPFWWEPDAPEPEAVAHAKAVLRRAERHAQAKAEDTPKHDAPEDKPATEEDD
jgi:hypothetical protein